jgi:hypothetical protein
MQYDTYSCQGVLEEVAGMRLSSTLTAWLLLWWWGQCFGEVAVAAARIAQDDALLQRLGGDIDTCALITRTADVVCVEQVRLQ